MIDLLIRNGAVVTPDATLPADIAVQGDKILALGAWGAFGEGRQEIDARGKLVLPGLVDPHVHMAHPYKGEISDDDCYSTTVSAAYGGTTTLIDFAIQWDKSLNLIQVLEWRRGQADDEVVVDYGLHVVPTQSSDEMLDDVCDLVERGIASFKVYMVYRKQGRMVDDAVLHAMLSALRDCGGTLMVHAENNAMAEYQQDRFLGSGRNRPEDFPNVKPNLVEAEAVNRALYLNRQCRGRLYIVHLSTREGLDLVRAAKANGDDVVAESCPHYLALTKDVYQRDNGGRYICSPPLRGQDDVDALWEGISDGTISTIGSDHCGFGKAQKDQGQGDFSQTPHGLPGIETRLPVIYTEGVLKRRITINRMVELLSTNPAKVFGLYPQKGALLPGSDADLVVVDPDEERMIRGEEMHGNVKWTPFEGMKARGFAKVTVSQGEIIVQDGQFSGNRGRGRFLERRIQ